MTTSATPINQCSLSYIPVKKKIVHCHIQTQRQNKKYISRKEGKTEGTGGRPHLHLGQPWPWKVGSRQPLCASFAWAIIRKQTFLLVLGNDNIRRARAAACVFLLFIIRLKIRRHRVKRKELIKRDGLDLSVCVDRDVGKKIPRACWMSHARGAASSIPSAGVLIRGALIEADIIWRIIRGACLCGGVCFFHQNFLPITDTYIEY